MDILTSALLLLGLIQKQNPVITPLPQKEIVLDFFTDKLAECESQRNPSIINPHDGGSPSYGYLQFKDSTFKEQIRFYKMLPHTEDKELFNFIFDKDVQIELAKNMIKDGKWKHWRNCAKKIGLDSFVYEEENDKLAEK